MMGERYNFEEGHRGRADLANEFVHFFLSMANSAGRHGLRFVRIGRHLRCEGNKDWISVGHYESTRSGPFEDRFCVEKFVRVLLQDSPVLPFEITTNTPHY